MRTLDNRAYLDGQTWHKVCGRDVLIERNGPRLTYYAYQGDQLVTRGIDDKHEQDVLRFLGQLYKSNREDDS